MEVDDIQTPQPPPCKFSRVSSNGARIDTTSKIGTHNKSEEAELRRGGPTTAAGTSSSFGNINGSGGGGGGSGGGGGEMVVAGGANNRPRQWQHSSRIIRVSRASGGKDRHSKVWTAKGPRDRRVRLSVTTAIQFYDLQDRLGYDQPSKAVEWLIKAAAESINELPSLNSSSFPPEEGTPALTQTPTQQQQQLSDEGRTGTGTGNVVDSADPELDGDHLSFGQNQQLGSMSMSKSGCSSNNSETSKGSGLSLSRSEIRVKARERARERTAKEKERENEQPNTATTTRVNNVGNNHQQHQHQQQNVQTSSFTQLLTAGISNLNDNNNGGTSSSPTGHHHGSRGNNNNNNQWLNSSSNSTSTPMDYFGVTTTGLMGHSSTSASRAGLIQLGSSGSLPQVMTISPFSIGGHENHHHHHQQHQEQLHHHHPHFPFFADQQQHHLVQAPHTGVGAGGGGGNHDYNLNFTISSSSTNSGQLVVGFNNNRGTLQSNSSSSSSLLPYLQRFSSSTTDGSSLPFFLGGTAVENHQHNQQFHPAAAGLQLCYGDGNRGQSDQKGKGKN